MKKIFMLPFLLFFFIPAIAEGYSFQTSEYKELRNFVNELEDNKYTPVRQDEKEAWLQEVRDGVEGASASLIRVRDAERARLAGIYAARVAAIEKKVNASLTRRLTYVNKWCKRKKRGKTAKQQAAIEKRCQAKRNAAKNSLESYKNKKVAEVERYWGKSSSRYKSIDRGYANFAEDVQEFLLRGEAAIEAMPIAVPVNDVAPTITGTVAVGEILTASAGEWSSSPEATFGYQWQRCNSAGTGCIDIPEATNLSYQVAPEDASNVLRVVVTATNIGGLAFEASALTVVVPA